MVELSLALGGSRLAGPPAQGTLSTELAVTGFYRARWMSLSGLPPGQAMEGLGAWRRVELAGFAQ